MVAEDARAAHGIVTPRIMERLLAGGFRPAPIVFDGDAVFITRTSAGRGVATIRQDLDLLVDLLRLLPRHVVEADAMDPLLKKMMGV